MRPKSRTEFRIAIICALTLEAEAVEALFDKTYDKFGKIYGKRRGDANSYINGRIGKHDVVLCYMPGMGKGSAASVASSLRVSYTGVQLALVVGICGGAPNPFGDQEIFLGDVIISNALVEYDFGRQYPRGFERKSDALRIPDQEIRTLLAALSTSRARAEFQEEMLHHLHNIQQQGPRWQHPGSADILFEASYLHKHYNPPSRCCCVDSNLPDDICEEAYEKNCNSLGCDENRISRRRDKTGKPSIHIGKVATADMVMKSGEHRDRIISKERVISFEMEGAGVWDNVSCIIIKGVCDYADSHKNKIWQAYAAATGASTAKAFLQYRSVDGEECLVESVTQSGIAKLPNLEASCNISTSLQIFQSEISALNTPLQGIQNTLSGFETRFVTLETLVSQLVHQPAINGSQQEINPAVITGRLLRKPGALKDICDAMKFRERSASNGITPVVNQHFGSTLPKTVGGGCSCMCHSLRRLQRKTIVHGSLVLSSETATERHLPGCPAKQNIAQTGHNRRFSLTYTGLQRLLNLAVQLSFTVTSGAGGGSLSPRFTYFPTVDSKTAPAWRMLNLLVDSGLQGQLWDKLASSVVCSIIKLFRTKTASPQAVDARNRSLVYRLVECVAMSPHHYEQHLLGQANAGPLLELLDYLLVNKAPANDYDLSGGTPLSRLFTFSTYGSVAKPRISAVAEAILQSNTEASVACLSEPPPAINSLILDQSGRRFYKEGTAVLLHFLGFSARIAEAYGCGPLSLAILSNNPDQVDYLVRNHPATLAERNIFGHTPLHLAADKSSCLRVLVTAADTKLLNETDEPGKFGKSALETAVCLSGLRCREGNSGRMCRKCRCAECAVILLNADCALPVSKNLQSVFRHASNRCKRRYVRHMKDRRDKLKQLALDNLPATEVEQLGLVPDHVLDSLASRVVHLLQVRGVCIPEALAVTRTRSLSVYQALRTPWDAEVFFQVGFYDTDSWCDCDAYAAEFGHSPNLTGELPYLHWLGKHGSISCQLKSFESAMDIAIANYTYYKIGEELDDISISWTFGEHLPWRDDKLSPFPTSARRAWVDELNTRILPAKIADTCDCKCSDEGCTPLTSLLKGLLRDNRYKFQSKSRFAKDTGLTSRLIQKISLFLKYFGSDLEVRHHTAALRYLTYTALGIPHTCCIPYYKWLYGLDAEEVENEHAYEMGLLEELMGDFERQIIAIYQGPRWKVSDLIDFWEHTWARRMREILDRLEGGDLGDEERHKAEEIGVIWDEPRNKAPKAAGNPYGKDTLDHWIYELEKIEAECDCSSFAPLPRFVMSGEGELGLGCSFVVKKDEISGDGRCASLRKHLSNSRGELSMEELDTFTDDDLRAAVLVEFQKQLAKVAFALAEEKSIAMEATGVNALCIYTAVVTWGVVMGRILYGKIGASYAPALAFMSGPAVISATSPLAQDPKRGDEVAAVASYRVLKEELPNIITGMTIKEVLDMATKLRKGIPQWVKPDFVALATWYSTAPLKDGAERTKRIVGQEKIGDAELKRGDDASIEDGVTSYKDLLRRRISALEETQSVADTAAATYLQSEQIVANLQAHQAKLNNTNKRRFSVEREITKAEMIIDDLKIMINGTKQQEGRIISVADLLASTLDDLMHVGEPPYHRPDHKIEDRLCTMVLKLFRSLWLMHFFVDSAVRALTAIQSWFDEDMLKSVAGGD